MTPTPPWPGSHYPPTAPLGSSTPEAAPVKMHWKAKLALAIHWMYCLSISFDAKGKSEGGSAVQFVYLAIALGAFGMQSILSWRRLLSRPIVWILFLWGGFIAFHTVNTVLQGNNLGNFVRVVLPYSLIAIGIAETIMAAGHGLRPSQLMTPIFVTMPINILWRLVHGFLFKGVTIETARYEVQSYGSSYLAAYNAAILILRPKFKAILFLPVLALAAGILITVTRGLLIPLAMGMIIASVLLVVGITWGVFHSSQIGKKAAGLAMFAAGVVGLLTLVGIAQPLIIERWTTRLFQGGGSGQATTKDLSLLSREAEALFMIKALNDDPVKWVHGYGIGALWGWDPSYYPEMYIVYPADTDFAQSYWFCGHSVWTYALYSGGVLGLLCHLILIFGAAWLSLRVMYLQGRAGPHPDTWMASLPILALFCIVSESFTSNPFDERLMGIGIGVTIGMLQALYNDLHWRRARLL